MGHYCHYCGRVRANEKFSGRGHRDHVCRDCQRRPREEREYIDRLEELHGFLRQSRISKKNQARLRVLSGHADPDVRNLAELIADVARVSPGRRRRLSRLIHDHWPIFARTVQRLSEEEWTGYFAPDSFATFNDWWYDAYQRAKNEAHGSTPCWCGSGRAYWNCCADRDDEAAASILDPFHDSEAWV